MRILLNPGESQGGGGVTTQSGELTPSQTASSPSPVTPVAAAGTATPQTVTLTFDQARDLFFAQQRLAEIERENQAVIEQKEREATLALAQKGEVEAALKRTEETYKTKLTALEQQNAASTARIHGETLSRVVTESLPLDQFVSPHAFAQVRDAIKAGLEVQQDAAGNLIVRERGTYRPAIEAIKERLASPEFAHCLKPRTTGGTGASGANIPAQQEQNANPQVNNLGEALVWAFNGQRPTAVSPFLDMAKPRWRTSPSRN